MDSRVVHSHVQEENDEQNSHNVEPYPVTLTHGPETSSDGLEEHNNSEPEKKSVMSRMKAKARKVRDSIKKHTGTGSGHDNEIQHDDGDLEEDKEMVQDPQAPIYDSKDVKSATPESEKVENLGNSGIDFEGTKFIGQEPHHAPLVEGVSSTTESNQNIATDKAKTFTLEDKAEQGEANLERQIDLEEDFQEQGSTLPTYQAKDIDLNGEVYDNEDVKGARPTPESEQVENLGNSGIDFDGTKVKSEERHHDSLVEGVSSTTEINQNIANDKANLFSVEEKSEQYKDNLERPIGLEEVSQEQESRSIGEGSDEIKGITPLQESLERMNVHDDEPKPTTETKVQPSVADTEYPPDGGRHDQFVPHFTDATKTLNEYPHETVSTDINRNHEIPSETEDTITNTNEKQAYYDELVEIQSKHKSSTDENDIIPSETVSTDINRNQEISEEDSQDQGSRNEANIHPNYQTKDTDLYGAESNEIKDLTPLEQSLERLNVHDDEPNPTTETKIQPFVTDIEYPPTAGSHDQSVPHFSDATKTQNEYPQETVSTDINRNHEIPSETEHTITNTNEKQAYYDELVEIQSIHKSSTDEVDIIPSATIADKNLPLENDETSKLSNDGTSTGSNDGTETKNEEKGATVKDYLAEKLRPSEEDKALSEVISEALHKGKEEPLKKEDGILASEDEKSEKVFEESNETSPGKGMVDRVKDYYGSWFAKPEENQSPHGVGIGEDLSKNKDSVAEVEQTGKIVNEGRVQE